MTTDVVTCVADDAVGGRPIAVQQYALHELAHRHQVGRQVGHRDASAYAWIAGESKVVTGLRRHLVKELHIDRSQVAFMGYWRRGVAMKS